MSVTRISLAAVLAVGLCSICRTSLAAVGGPSTVDANTLHLWHMDDATGPTTPIIDSVGTNTLNLTNIDQSAQANNATGGTTPATANAVISASSLAGFSNAAGFANNALIPATAAGGGTNTPHRPVLLGAAALSNADADAVSTWSFSNTSTNAFTWEALIKFDASFDPTTGAANYRIGGASAPGNVGGNYPMEIISGEGDTNGHRNWQFRIDQKGTGQAVVTATGIGFSGAGLVATGTDNTMTRLEFANLHGIGAGSNSNQSIAIALPSTGPNAVNNTDWFHVAVQYNGSPNAADNIAFFWTDVSNPANASLTSPTFLASTLMVNNLLTAAANLPGFAIGDESRDAGSGAGEGESFVGQIDEVRMSDATRYAVPEPSTFVMAGLGLVGLVGFARRRSA